MWRTPLYKLLSALNLWRYGSEFQGEHTGASTAGSPAYSDSPGTHYLLLSIM